MVALDMVNFFACLCFHHILLMILCLSLWLLYFLWLFSSSFSNQLSKEVGDFECSALGSPLASHFPSYLFSKVHLYWKLPVDFSRYISVHLIYIYLDSHSPQWCKLDTFSTTPLSLDWFPNSLKGTIIFWITQARCLGFILTTCPTHQVRQVQHPNISNPPYLDTILQNAKPELKSSSSLLTCLTIGIYYWIYYCSTIHAFLFSVMHCEWTLKYKYNYAMSLIKTF